MIRSVRTLKLQMQKRVFIQGDRVVKMVNGFLLARNINHKYLFKDTLKAFNNFRNKQQKCVK